jgi:drug/metabolite transporter (DMT)-like permease
MRIQNGTRTGYVLALLSAAVSGIAIYVNSLGVKMFTDAALYTTLKNAVVGVALLIPLVVLARQRRELARLTAGKWSLLLVLALISGSIPFLLFFRGLQLTNGVTGALLNHLQFVFVAVFASVALRERINGVMWAGLAVLVAGTLIGVNTGAVRWNEGALMVLASSVLFAAGFVLAKYLLAELSTLTVMAARMTLGTVALGAYVAATGHLSAMSHLSATQWSYVVLTGIILLAFTVTTFTAIARVRVSAVIAIQMAAPAVTVLLQSLAEGRLQVVAAAVPGLVLTLAAVAVIVLVGMRDDRRAPVQAPSGSPG